MISILFGLSSAVSWGAADFFGGLGTRRLGAYKTVFFQEAIGLLLLIPAAWILREPVPPARVWILGLLAGLLGNAGLLLLYRALATGRMSIAAPVSALMTAALPVIVGALAEGFPGLAVSIGFAFALAAIWLVSQTEDDGISARGRFADLRLPLLAGIGFGCFFIFMHAATVHATVWPMIASRTTGLVVIGMTLLARRENWSVQRSAWRVVIPNGVLDIGGNAFFVLAGQLGRLDIASVLGSLYPGGTVLLASLVLKERLSRIQWLGICAALIAIVLFTM